MNPWRQFPLIRLIFLFIAGICTGFYFPETSFFILTGLSLFFCAYLQMVIFSKRLISFNIRWLPGIIISFLMMGLSYQITVNKGDINHWNYAGNITSGKAFYIADIAEPVTQKPGTAKAILRIEAVRMKDKWLKATGKILVYFQKDDKTKNLDYGDRVLFYAAVKEPPGPTNPYSYDYRRFLKTMGISIQAYVKTGQWEIISRNEQNPLIALALSFRKSLLDIFRNNKMEGREFAVGAALLLGYVDEIDPRLIKDYSATGAMHILSVSGMHVGIIFVVLEKLLAFLRRFKYGITIKTILIILFIWFYAMLTGLSSAVLRAAAMLSLVTIGNSIQRSPDILNTLAASLLLLLIWNPCYMMDVGFQLSYMAVGGIILLNKSFYNLFQPSNWFIDQIWAIMAVSLSAQIATFPLSLYYFHQFPNYFMITNIIVVPLSSLIIYIGILLLFFGSVPFISFYVAKILIFLIGSLNGSIHFIEELPFSTMKGIVISEWELILLYLFFIGMILFFNSKRKAFLILSLTILIVLSGSWVMKKIVRLERKKLIVYHLQQGSAFEFIDQGKSILAGNQIFALNDFSADIIQNTRIVLGYKEKLKLLIHPMVRNPKPVVSGIFYKKGNFIQFNGKKIAIINSNQLPDAVSSKLKLDLLIITGSPKIKIADLLKVFTFREVVIDATNPAWKIRDWIKEAETMGIRYYSLSGSGAFVMDF